MIRIKIEVSKNKIFKLQVQNMYLTLTINSKPKKINPKDEIPINKYFYFLL
jgi:hypothetical protein